MNAETILIDVRYALRQLRQFGDVPRAIDALERVEANLQAAEQPYHCDKCDDGEVGTDTCDACGERHCSACEPCE